MNWYRLVLNSRLPALLGHDAFALWPFVFYAKGSIPPDTLRHEVQHLRQQLVVAAIAAAVVMLLPVSRWWLLLSHPLLFLLLYLLSCLRGYSRSWFERDAERKRQP